MKHNRIAQLACLALIIAGVFFTTSHAQATVFPHPGTTGCTAPVGGDAIGGCGNVEQSQAKTPAAPRHWHWHRHHWHHHYRHSYHFHRHHH